MIDKSKIPELNQALREINIELKKVRLKFNDLLEKRREKLIKFLKSKGIETAIHYPRPIHLQPAAKYLGYKKSLILFFSSCRVVRYGTRSEGSLPHPLKGSSTFQ